MALGYGQQGYYPQPQPYYERPAYYAPPPPPPVYYAPPGYVLVPPPGYYGPRYWGQKAHLCENVR